MDKVQVEVLSRLDYCLYADHLSVRALEIQAVAESDKLVDLSFWSIDLGALDGAM